MKKFGGGIFVVILLVLSLSVHVSAVEVLIGDIDGFGFAPEVVPTLKGTDLSGNHIKADRNGDGILNEGDVLPDLSGKNGVPDYKTSQWDIFDYREAGETPPTSDGAHFTDVTLSGRYTAGLAEDAVFTFRFAVPDENAPDYGKSHFFSLIYGDYDVGVMQVIVDGQTIDLIGNQEAGVNGYIGMAYASVPWGKMTDGVVEVKIVAPSEPFVAFEVLRLSLEIGIPSEPTPEPTQEPTPEPTQEPTPEPTQEPTPEPTQEPTPEPTQEPTPEPTQEPTPEPTWEPTQGPTPPPAVPEPGTMLLLGSGLIGILGLRRKFKK